MSAQVSIRFGPDVTVDIRVPFASDAAAQAQGRDWLDRAFHEFGCEPIRLTGKVLLLDKVLAVADAAGEKHFRRDPAWGELYAKAVTSALQRTLVQVDVEGRTVSS